jgi:thiol peroxidase
VQHLSEFNEECSEFRYCCILTRDLPFAQKDSGAEESMMLFHIGFKDGSFGKNNGLEIVDGPLAGLHSRVLIVDSNGTVYTQSKLEIADEPNYELH